ncbi:ArsR/SmtB family transcription factor [Aquisalinus flavus]|uniref:ArsR family transcriptional regulator n=1 Tax=Aquisalinus flavus TaxID=1526572 RepID=A0A8J2Y3P7_9PROT|nr:metalloregulator ArsR/SmtB family transcription factor [Aquisalinus flavus]MBD0426435.1 metalloregulator ArsR/SmtB family transcription factor [Aquisalinus flavus]UNE48011.1 metalloregulator ArsR/SmtB family transcription factor [Aquisalinus flavus]GGD07931.1 ArsR family transcriptional regulator [Aquisalinus flavus]
MPQPPLDSFLTEIRALGEETRLRIVLLLSRGELTVSELTQILQQSQPRVSRHVNILADAGLVEGHREGAWVFYRLNPASVLLEGLEDVLPGLHRAQDEALAEDATRLSAVMAARAAVAADFFQRNAESWEKLRRLHTPESDIEQKMRELAGDAPVGKFIDLGTGTGRMLIVFRDLYERAIGYDVSREMLAVARTLLSDAGVENAQVRQGDIFDLADQDGAEHEGSADFVCIHHVLHFLPDPAAAVKAARKLLRPGGRMMIVDFAPHELEHLREEYAHRRLGFSDADARGWAKACGLTVGGSETLTPGADEQDRLSVKLWLLKAPRESGAQAQYLKESIHV